MISKNKLKYLISLKRQKVRQKEGKILLEGLRLVEEASRSDFALIELFVYPPKIRSHRAEKIIEACRKDGVTLHEIDAAAVRALADTVQSQGVFAMAHIPGRSFDQVDLVSHRTFLALDGLHDPGNLGTIIRTADWFAVDGLLLARNSVEVTNAKVIRSSMGSLFHLPAYPGLDLLRQTVRFKAAGYSIFCADAHRGQSIYEVEFGRRNLFLFGSEASGLHSELAAAGEAVTIPGSGRTESLNVAISVGVVLSELRRREMASEA